MKERLAKLYKEKRITKEGLYLAVSKNWITEDEYNEIISKDE